MSLPKWCLILCIICGPTFGVDVVVFPDEGNSRPIGPPTKAPRPTRPPRDDTTFGPNEARLCSADKSCLPLEKCPLSSFNDFENLDQLNCKLSDRSGGVCCPSARNPNPGVPFKQPVDDTEDEERLLPENGPKITDKELNDAAEKGIQFVKDMDSLEEELAEKQLLAVPRSREASHQNFFGNSLLAQKLSRDGLLMLRTTVEVAKNLDITDIQTRKGLRKFTLQNTVVRDRCPKPTPCPPTKYRSADGSCNNLNNPEWGKSFTAFNRLLTPDYGDGVDTPRLSATGRSLPSAREVSFTVATDRDSPNKALTLLLMQFGQFLDHDMTSTATTRPNNGQAFQCCGRQFQQNPRLLHPACFPISLPRNDPFYARFRTSCMSFVRSAPAPRPSCILGPREQLNQLSAYLDGGMIYGHTEENAQRLRALTGGRLIWSLLNDREFLPMTNQTSGCGIPRERNQACFVAGDGRVNVQLELVVMHAIWLKEHNRVADMLRALNPGWDDEVLYQEARRVVGAQIQHITYNEFLSIILGKRVMEAFDLVPLKEGLLNKYSPKTNPGILSAFSTAAYRFHTLIQGTIEFRNGQNRKVDEVDLSETFNNPSLIYQKGAFVNLINGLTGQPSQGMDRFASKQVTNHLFRSFGSPFGIDLIALNIQRGRDHGIPGYNVWRKTCGLSRIDNFDQLSRVMSANAVTGLRSLYSRVDDIDLFIAGAAETPFEGALVGPIFACILGEQFKRLKFGDRFWYENGGQESSLTEEQLQEIRKTSLARVLCDNGDDIQVMQRFPFIRPLEWNKKVSCDVIPRMDLRPWDAKRAPREPPKVTKRPEITRTPEVSKTTEAPKTTRTPKTTRAPKRPEIPKTSKEPRFAFPTS